MPGQPPPKSYDEITRRTVPDPEGSWRPSPQQEKQAHEGFRALDAFEQDLHDRVRDALIAEGIDTSRIAIEVAGFSPAESDGFRRAMGTWRSSREMEKLHARFVEGCLRQPGMTDEMAEELFRQVAAFASFGFAKSHAAAFARTAYESRSWRRHPSSRGRCDRSGSAARAI